MYQEAEPWWLAMAAVVLEQILQALPVREVMKFAQAAGEMQQLVCTCRGTR